MTIPFLFPILHTIRRHAGYRYPRLGPLCSFLRRHAPPELQVELFPGIQVQLALADETQFQTYWYGTRFEEPTGAILQEWWRHATHFFDIGSNYGFFSLWAASLGGHLEIHAFEPNPDTFARLNGFARANKLSSMVLNPIALSDCAATLALQLEKENTGASHLIEGAIPAPGQRVASVRALSFDDYAADLNLGRLSSVAKIDVEGMELRVLRGMAAALRQTVFRGICIELLDEHLNRGGTSVAEVDAFLREHGYRRRGGPPPRQNPGANEQHNSFYQPS